jgi:hypothetical protein
VHTADWVWPWGGRAVANLLHLAPLAPPQPTVLHPVRAVVVEGAARGRLQWRRRFCRSWHSPRRGKMCRGGGGWRVVDEESKALCQRLPARFHCKLVQSLLPRRGPGQLVALQRIKDGVVKALDLVLCEPTPTCLPLILPRPVHHHGLSCTTVYAFACLPQPFAHRLPPPCATQNSVAPTACLPQPFVHCGWHQHTREASAWLKPLLGQPVCGRRSSGLDTLVGGLLRRSYDVRG